MIDAHFDAAGSRMTSVSGVYQYDTGQRLRLRGIPAPAQLGAADDYIDTIRDEAGNILADEARTPTVQVHYGYAGDSQTEMRLAIWNAADEAWLADVPDEYLSSCEPVYLYVYVYHGETQEETRAKTMYHGVFTPIRRPAPNNMVTPEQLQAWTVMLEEIDAAAGIAQEDTDKAKRAAEAAKKAAQDAAEPTQAALDAARQVSDALAALEGEAGALGGMEIEVRALESGSAATAEIARSAEGTKLTLGIPSGADGARGEAGDTGPGDCTIVFSDGALTITTN